MIIRYYRKKGVPKGCIVALEDGKIGWSFCCKKDVFTKKMAREIALGRAFKYEDRANLIKMPREMQRTLEHVCGIIGRNGGK
jgi:hypothetical protein